MPNNISPIDAANALSPHWMRKIADFDALEIHPCAVIERDSNGTEFIEQCEPEEAHFWTVYGHRRTGGLDAFEDFSTEGEAIIFYDRLLATFAQPPGIEGKRHRSSRAGVTNPLDPALFKNGQNAGITNAPEFHSCKMT